MRRHLLTVALAALGLAAAPIADATAQGSGSFCGGALQLADIYSTLSASNAANTTSFFLVLQNRTPNEVNFAVTVSDQRLSSRPNPTQFTKLARYGASQPVLLGTQRMYINQASGAVTLRDMRAAVRVACQ